jgi:hypothetical protein
MIPSNPPVRLNVELAVHALTNGLPHSCPLCDGDTQIHQPDDSTPDRLLATCARCKTWFLIDESETSMVQLPW